MAEAISTQPLAIEIRVGLQAIPFRIYDGQICTERACFRVLMYASLIIFNKSPYPQLTVYHQPSQSLEIDRFFE
jgi:hypothetical protein